MPYHAIVRTIVRSTWKKINDGDLEAPWRMAAEDLEFTFGGDTPLSGQWVGRDHLRDWLHDLRDRFEVLDMRLDEVVVGGWPWNTTVATRLSVSGRWKDGEPYENVATQWVTLRWGKMTRDWVMEDTEKLSAALRARSST
jgi:ketosteroid isomerase-like protein